MDHDLPIKEYGYDVRYHPYQQGDGEGNVEIQPETKPRAVH